MTNKLISALSLWSHFVSYYESHSSHGQLSSDHEKTGEITGLA